MKLKIHRGTREIGGSCVEIWTTSTRILVDIGMPLMERDGSDFDFEKYKNLTAEELLKAKVLPDIEGLYDTSVKKINAVIISHPHQDHYGLFNYVNKEIPCYLGKATHEIIKLGNIFTSQKFEISQPVYFEKEICFQIGDIVITPFWADHSAFDSYSFLVEAEGIRVFYSGDFRNHGRKSKAFYWFTHNAPVNIDYLLLEGTSIGRDRKSFESERIIEKKMADLFKEPEKLNLVYSSGQNIDRIVSVYRACLKAGKTMVVDVYVASILKSLSTYARIPFPSDNFKNLKVFFPYYLSKRLSNQGMEKILYQFKQFMVKKEEISVNPEKYVMLVRPSMKKDLEYINGIDSGNLIYSMWEGYLKKKTTEDFINYLNSRNFSLHHIHTSGHADLNTLKKMVEVLNPKHIVPIHTLSPDEYHKIFSAPVVELRDGETLEV